jgi:hypothetical protein
MRQRMKSSAIPDPKITGALSPLYSRLHLINERAKNSLTIAPASSIGAPPTVAVPCIATPAPYSPARQQCDAAAQAAQTPLRRRCSSSTPPRRLGHREQPNTGGHQFLNAVGGPLRKANTSCIDRRCGVACAELGFLVNPDDVINDLFVEDDDGSEETSPQCICRINFDHCKARCTENACGNYSSIGVDASLGQQENMKKHWQFHYESSYTCFGDGELSYVAPFSFLNLAFHT